MSRTFLRVAAGALAATLAADVTSAQSYTTFGSGCAGSGGTSCVVLPKAFRTKMGSTANRLPHSTHNSRCQQIFLGSEIGKPRVFTQLCLRLDERYIARAGTQTIEVRLGPSDKTDKTLSPTFAENYSGRPVTVFKGTIRTPAHAGNGGLSSWGICIDFSTKYVYGGGNLIVEMIESSNSSVAHFADACDKDSGSNTARVYALDKDATTGTVDLRRGLIMRLCGDGGGIPTLRNTGLPVLGRSFDVKLSSAKPGALALLFLGRRINFDMTSVAPGCFGLAMPEILLGTRMPNANGDASATIPVPNMPALRGYRFANQWYINDPVNPLQFVFSNGGEGIIG